MNDYQDFLKNKTVALVGPSKSLEYTENNGAYIDSFDVVVRINKGLDVLGTPFSGKRSDVLYNSLDLDPASGGYILPEALKDHKVKFVRSPYAFSEGFHSPLVYSHPALESLVSTYSLEHIDPDLYFNIKKETNSRVNSGLGAIVDLLSYNISKLYITGIDFYRSSYLSNYNPHKKWETKKDTEEDLEFLVQDDDGHHHPDRQYRYFKDLFNTEDRIELDTFMSKIITDTKYDSWETIPDSGY